MKPIFRGVVLLAAFALGGCASTHNPRDPLEGFNRAMFRFNDTLDQAALKPAAIFYRDQIPKFVQTGVSNFFGNLGDVWTAVNNALQGKIPDALSDVVRVIANTTFGLGGVIDVGSQAGLPKHREDFGQTLGSWGVNSGPYLVLPLLGSSTLRDTAALPLDFRGDLWLYVDPVGARVAGSVVRLIDLRANLLDASTLVEEAALDRYSFLRDSYMQRRESAVYDGESREYRNGNKKMPRPDDVDSAPPESTQPVPENGKPAGTSVAPTEPGAQSTVTPSDLPAVAELDVALSSRPALYRFNRSAPDGRIARLDLQLTPLSAQTISAPLSPLATDSPP